MAAVDSSVIDHVRFNPLATNEFRSRDDVAEACRCLFEPLLPYFSPGKARVQIDSTTSTWDRAACDLEGWARPLFGIAPYVAGGGEFAYWALYREGLKNGTDPEHPEYWGDVKSLDQRHVEAAAIGYALILVPKYLWEPLDDKSKGRVAKWLLRSREGEHAPNNHMFFRILVDRGLQNVGVEIDEAMTNVYLDRIDDLYMEDGFYRDSKEATDSRRIDWYNPWALHYYGLFYATCFPGDKVRAARFRERARTFAKHCQHWFADTGSNVPYGRSLTYRHCVVAFWGALAVANEEALPWGVIKGLYLRCLRWWSTQPISRNGDGILSLGYSYPNQLICERYSSAGSPYWANKAFLPLALPADHPFWATTELPINSYRDALSTSPISGMVFAHQPNHTILLVSGPGTSQLMRGIPEKYQKFAYSTRYGFSVESDPLGFKMGAFDSMIAFSDDETHYRVRESCVKARIAGSCLYSLWRPWNDVTVETWLIPQVPWHVRIHRIHSPRTLSSIEGAFAAPRTDFDGDTKVTEDNRAFVISALGDFVGIADDSTTARKPRVIAPHGNTSVMFPRTLVSQLQGIVRGGESTVVRCAVLAGPDAGVLQPLFRSLPTIPTVEECEALIDHSGIDIEICKDVAESG